MASDSSRILELSLKTFGLVIVLIAASVSVGELRNTVKVTASDVKEIKTELKIQNSSIASEIQTLKLKQIDISHDVGELQKKYNELTNVKLKETWTNAIYSAPREEKDVN